MDPTGPDHPTDEALLADFLKGRAAALEALARRYEGPLLGLASALLDGRTDMASDAIQDTWVKVIRHGASFKGKSAFKTWLYRIAINQCKSVKARAAGATARGALAAQQCEPHPDPDDKPALRSALRELSADRRIVILLCYHAGMTHEHAAEILGLPLGTLKTRLRAAMTDLRARLHAETMP